MTGNPAYGMYGNPSYNMFPDVPPGLAAVPYIAGSIFAPMVGGVASPYVHANQSTYDAWMATHVNKPMYDAVMRNVYGQLGYQYANTLGNTMIAKTIANMAGYPISRMQEDLRGAGTWFGSSGIGLHVMPQLDALASNFGFYNGSVTDAAGVAFNNRMSLLPFGSYINPYNVGQQHMTMAGTSALLTALNGMMSKKDENGNLTMLTNPAFTQGFDRSKITKLVMMLAGAGGLSGAGGGFVEQLTSAAGGLDIAELDYTSGDYTGGGPMSRLRSDTALKVRDVHDKAKKRIESFVQVVGAMRDLLKEVDGVEEKIVEMTGGDVLRGTSSDQALANVRRFTALTQMYNLNPNSAWDNMVQTRDMLRAAAVGGPEQAAVAKYFGFDGGGLFRLGAQTELMASIADRVRAQNADRDPVRAAAIMNQGVQAMARNMNTQAGVAVQLLAYGRQLGILSEDDAERIRQGITSGDRSVMERSVNDMLVTEFGSAKKGRQLMQDRMFMNSVQQSLSDDAGKYAMKIMVSGADREWMRQEKITAASDRAAFSRDIMSRLGMNVRPTDADIGKLVESVQSTLRKEDGGDAFADAFGEQVNARVQKGMSKYSAFYATVNAFKSDPATAQYAERISLAIDQTMADSREAAIKSAGLESGQAKAMADSLRRNGLIDSKQYSAIQKLIRSGNGKSALDTVNGIVSGLSPANQTLLAKVKESAVNDYNMAVQSIDDKKAVAELIDIASKSEYGSKAIVDSFNDTIDAARKYMSSGKTGEDYVELQDAMAKSRFSLIFGNEKADALIAQLQGPDGAAVLQRMGRQAINLQQLAVTGLREKGYDLNYNGIWGSGRNAGNTEAVALERQGIIDQIVANISEDQIKSAGDRTKFSEDFVDFMTGNKNWKELIKIHDKTGILGGENGITAAYTQYVEAFEAAQSLYNQSYGSAREVKAKLDSAGRYAEARKVDELLKNPDARAIDEFINANKDVLDDEYMMRGFNDLIDKRRNMLDLSDKTQQELVKMSENADLPDAIRKLKDNISAATVTESKYDSAEKYMVGLDTDSLVAAAAKARDQEDSWVKRTFTAADEKGQAYLAAIKAVSDQEVADELGYENISGLDSYKVVSTRMKLAKEKAMKGDSVAMDAMKKAEALSNKDSMRIRGEITIKDGRDEAPAVLDGNIGGISQ